MSTVYLNGVFRPSEQASVSVDDRGFLFGDGVYEVIPVYAGCPFRLDAHLARLERSLAGIRLANPYPPERWRALLERLVGENGGGDLLLYLQVTRGTAARREHVFPQEVRPTVYASASPAPAPPLAGVAAVVARDIRWGLCHIKAIALLPNALLRQQAAEAGALEAILVRDGLVTEGAASNVFVVRGGEVATPPEGPSILSGITRALVLELLAAAGSPGVERPVAAEELTAADEVWITSSSREVVPVVALDGRAVGGGRPGPAWRRVHELYRAHKARAQSECRVA